MSLNTTVSALDAVAVDPTPADGLAKVPSGGVNNGVASPSTAPSYLAPAGSTSRGPVETPTITDFEPSDAPDSLTAVKSCDAILQDAIRLADQLKLKLSELSAAQAAGGKITDEELRARAAHVSEELSAAVHNGLEAITASVSCRGDAGSIGAGAGGQDEEEPEHPALECPRRRVWEISELRQHIISYLPRGGCATMLRVSRSAFDSAVGPLYKSHEFELDELVSVCEAANSYRRSSYASSVTELTIVEISEIPDFVWLFGAGHKLERCSVVGIGRCRGEDAATLEWSRTAGSDSSNVKIFRNLRSDGKNIPRVALLSLVRRTDQIEWSADVTCDGYDGEWIRSLGRGDRAFIGAESLRRVRIDSANADSLHELLESSCWWYGDSPDDVEPYALTICGTNADWTQNMLAHVVSTCSRRIDILDFTDMYSSYNCSQLLDDFSTEAQAFSRIRKLDLAMSLHVHGAPSSLALALPLVRSRISGMKHEYDDYDEQKVEHFRLFFMSVSTDLDDGEMALWMRALARSMVRIGGRKCRYECIFRSRGRVGAEMIMIMEKRFNDGMAELLS